MDKDKQLLRASLVFVKTACVILEEKHQGILEQWNEIERDIRRDLFSEIIN